MTACTPESEFSGVRESLRELSVSIVEWQMCLTGLVNGSKLMQQGVRVNRKWIRVGVDNQARANASRREVVGICYNMAEHWYPEPFLLTWAPSGESTNPPMKDRKYE